MLDEHKNTIINIKKLFDDYQKEFKRINFGELDETNIKQCIKTIKTWYKDRINNINILTLNKLDIDEQLKKINHERKSFSCDNLYILIDIIYKLGNLVDSKNYDLKTIQKQLRISFDLIKDFLLFNQCYTKLDTLIYANIELLINKCIILDNVYVKEHTHTNLINELNTRLKTKKISNHKLFYYSANLNLRLHKYETALKYFINTTKILKENLYGNIEKEYRLEYFNSILKTAFCYELIEKYEEGIKLLNTLKDNNFHALDIIDEQKDKNKIKKEVYHLLGHLYNEKSIKNPIEKNSYDGYSIYKGKEYLKKSSCYDHSIQMCIGIALSDYGEHKKALLQYIESLDNLNTKYPSNPHEKSELEFYIGYSYYKLNNSKEAEYYFNKYDNYCKNFNHTDGLSITTIFRIKFKIYNKKISEINFNEIETLIHKLISNKPSRYSNTWLRNEWQKLFSLLHSFWYIKKILDKDITINNILDDILYHLKKYISTYNYSKNSIDNDNNEKISNTNLKIYTLYSIPIYSISNIDLEKNSTIIEFKFDKFIKRDLTELYNDVANLRETNNILICLEKHFPDDTLNRLKELLEYNRKVENVNYIIYETGSVSIIEQLKNKYNNLNSIDKIKDNSGNSTIYYNKNIDDAIKTILILNIYEKIRKTLLENNLLCISTFPVNKSINWYIENITTFIDEKKNTDKKPSIKDFQFNHQINNIENWFLSRLKSEEEAETKETYIHFFKDTLRDIQLYTEEKNIVFSAFYNNNFDTPQYRINYFNNIQKNTTEKIDTIKPYSNSGIKEAINNIYDYIDDKIKYCENENCNTNYDKECKYTLENYKLKLVRNLNLKIKSSDNLIDNIKKLIAEIPNNNIKLNDNYSIFIKKLRNQRKTFGLIITIFKTLSKDTAENICKINNNSFIDYYSNKPVKKTHLNYKKTNSKSSTQNSYNHIDQNNNFLLLMNKVNKAYIKYKEDKYYQKTAKDLKTIKDEYIKIYYKLKENDKQIIDNIEYFNKTISNVLKKNKLL